MEESKDKREEKESSAPESPSINKLPQAGSETGSNGADHYNDPSLRPSPMDFDSSAHKFDLEPHPEPLQEEPAPPEYEYLGELPEAYGTKKIYLVARDPNWVYAYWDFTADQIREGEAAAHDGKVFLQLYHASGERQQQIYISTWARDWFLHVNQPNTQFYAEIGYYHADGRFEVMSRSGDALTPREDLSPNTDARFVTIPFEFSFRELLDMVRDQMLEGEELADALARLQEEGFAFPFGYGKGRPLTGGPESAFEDDEIVRTIRVGSFDFTEVIRKRMSDLQSSGQWTSSMSSPFGSSWQKPSDFFLNVNAELIIYGGTHPDATLRIDGQNIELQPDGTFRFHFNFRDGKYHIPVEATSPDGLETRSALMSFMRLSALGKGVDPTHQPPRSEPMGRLED